MEKKQRTKWMPLLGSRHSIFFIVSNSDTIFTARNSPFLPRDAYRTQSFWSDLCFAFNSPAGRSVPVIFTPFGTFTVANVWMIRRWMIGFLLPSCFSNLALPLGFIIIQKGRRRACLLKEIRRERRRDRADSRHHCGSFRALRGREETRDSPLHKGPSATSDT